MSGSGLWRPVLIGALAAILLIGGLVVALQVGLIPSSTAPTEGAAEKGVLLAVTLPAEDGVVTPRVVVYYPPGGGTPQLVDPKKPATVAGTSANTLGDAYAFGGGSGLTRAFSAATNAATPLYVTVDQTTWRRLFAADTISVELTSPVDVYTGTDLVSFPEGLVAVDATQSALLLDGADHLSDPARASIIAGLAAGTQRLLIARGSTLPLATDASQSDLATWRLSLPARTAPEWQQR